MFSLPYFYLFEIFDADSVLFLFERLLLMTLSDFNRYDIGVFSSLFPDTVERGTARGFSQWWYFDALSDNGEDAVIVDFLATPALSTDTNGREQEGNGLSIRKPTVSFEYYRKGKLLYRASCEYPPDQLSSDPALGICRIGDSHFELGSADYGSGYSLKLDLPMARGRRLKAGMEWLFIESDLLGREDDAVGEKSIWNVVAPRADVTGRFEVTDGNGRTVDTCHFRGSGYHDQRSGPANFLENFSTWTWGRIHFPDSTAIFLAAECGDVSMSKLLVVRDSTFRVRDAACLRQSPSHDRLGIKYDRHINVGSDDGLELIINRLKPLSSGMYMLRFICEMELRLRDGKPRKSLGISECISPKRLRRGWMTRLSGLFSGRQVRP